MKSVNHVGRITSVLTVLLFFTYNTILFAHGELKIFPLRYIAAPLKAPVLDKIESDDLLYTKGDGRVAITSTLTITDADDKNINSATIRITSGFNTSEDILRFNKQNRISGYWNQSTGILNLTGRSSVADYQAALRSIRYENTNTHNPSTNTRVVSFMVNDGQENSNTLSRNIVINTPNAAPVLTNIETVPVIYCINSGGEIITSTISVFDANNANLTAAYVQITDGYTPNEDFLRFTDQNGIIGSWDPSRGILSLSGVTLIANYQAALRSIRYENTNSVNPFAGNRVISFTVNDGINMSNSLTRSIGVNGHISAVLTGSASICNDDITTVPLSIDFSGTSPWVFTLMKDNGNEVSYKDIALDPFILNVRQEGTYRIKSITDAYCTGDTTGSGYARIIYKASPTAIISGVDTICPGETAELQVDLTGTIPWSITYTLNGSNQTVINNILSTHYTLRDIGIGTYALTRVEDALCKGKVSGIGIVREYIPPIAVISGNATFCEYSSANLNVVLTGTSPWKFIYRRNAENPIEIPNVLSSPRVVSVQQAGTYTLYEVFDKNCKGTVSGNAVINMIQAPEVELSGLALAYDKQSSEWATITGTPSGGTFSGPGVIFYNLNWYFVPALPPVGTHNIVYSYRASPSSCYGYDTAVVRVIEADAMIDFENGRTKYCLNDGPFTITGANVALDTGSFSISGNVGLTDHHDNTATIYPDSLENGEYTITYNYEMLGKSYTWPSKFEIGNYPTADFSWASECFQAGQSISFNNTSTPSFGYLNDTSYFWKIYNKTGFTYDTTRNITHTFPEPGKHLIELQVQNSYGCSDTVTKEFLLRPTISLDGKIYFENFDASPIGWQSGTSPTEPINSWKLGTPSKHGEPGSPLLGFSGAKTPPNCWYTSIPTNPAPTEHSWVTSPCFDFTGTEKPMVKLDIWRLFDSQRDGANLQASADSGKTWMLIGLLGDGVNWYNSYAIDGKPGPDGSGIGWSNNDNLYNDVNWVEARHSLDMLKGKTSVQFRISYGSANSAQNNDGIAFDDFSIVERNRTALIEHFTNSSTDTCAVADLKLDKLINDYPQNVIDLQYHTSNPSNDPFYEDNPVIPTTREFYYGLSGVPYALINGGSKSQHRFDYTPLSKNTAIIESLLDSKFQIVINKQVHDNTLNIETEVSALDDVPLTEISVRIAVIERVINGITGDNGDTSFRSVVKAMLPSAAGTTIYKAWSKGEYRYINQSWDMENVYNPMELRIVVFIQNESTHEIYQSTLDTSDIYTGIDNPFPGSPVEKSFIVYPNPAERSAYIKFNQETVKGVTIELYNSLGRLVYSARMPAGTDMTKIPVEDYPDGLYFLRLVGNDKLMGTSKLIISK